MGQFQPVFPPLQVQSQSIPVCRGLDVILLSLILVSLSLSGFRFLQESLGHLWCDGKYNQNMWVIVFEWMYVHACG